MEEGPRGHVAPYSPLSFLGSLGWLVPVKDQAWDSALCVDLVAHWALPFFYPRSLPRP